LHVRFTSTKYPGWKIAPFTLFWGSTIFTARRPDRSWKELAPAVPVAPGASWVTLPSTGGVRSVSGGDAAIAYANGYGYYIKATVLKGTGRPAPVSLTSAPSGGCTYDTQCKGDRVCVAGACVDPKR